MTDSKIISFKEKRERERLETIELILDRCIGLSEVGTLICPSGSENSLFEQLRVNMLEAKKLLDELGGRL